MAIRFIAPKSEDDRAVIPRSRPKHRPPGSLSGPPIHWDHVDDACRGYSGTNRSQVLVGLSRPCWTPADESNPTRDCHVCGSGRNLRRDAGRICLGCCGASSDDLDTDATVRPHPVLGEAVKARESIQREINTKNDRLRELEEQRRPRRSDEGGTLFRTRRCHHAVADVVDWVARFRKQRMRRCILDRQRILEPLRELLSSPANSHPYGSLLRRKQELLGTVRSIVPMPPPKSQAVTHARGRKASPQRRAALMAWFAAALECEENREAEMPTSKELARRARCSIGTVCEAVADLERVREIMLLRDRA